MPPSKVKGDPMYDDRMVQVLCSLSRICGLELDVRELIYQTASTRASSRSAGHRLTLPELRETYRIDPGLAEPVPRRIGVFDDLLTSGAHFRAARELLTRRWPHLRVVGIFLARSLRSPGALG
jgi:predicted amidophosphoribosyltransferase